MAEDLNQQEPTAEEKAKFENDVLKAAEDTMKMDGSTGSPIGVYEVPELKPVLSVAEARGRRACFRDGFSMRLLRR